MSRGPVAHEPDDFDQRKNGGGAQYIRGRYWSYTVVSLGVAFVAPGPHGFGTAHSHCVLRALRGRRRYYVVPHGCMAVATPIVLWSANVMVLGPFRTWDEAVAAHDTAAI